MMVRLRLTTKQVNGGYYKGNRTGSMGHFDKRGTYRPDLSKHRVYMPAKKLEIPGRYYTPETSKEPFNLAPFITKHMRRTPSNYVQDIERNGRRSTVIRGFEGHDYLEKWADTAEAAEARLAQPYPENIKTIESKSALQVEQPDQTEQIEQTEQTKSPKPTQQPTPMPNTPEPKHKKFLF
ncbi:uncharacterized protein PGRI_006390 [Penicillium griseofulvum]|uniref:Ribosomal protein L27/L41, mitochondrial n=1 Tax=Penicillium patulum TaxID=5078 RepID=A0A135LX96_PENPA|nr:uncharacterized protein PGRI_006390 [Penicillium griseofulvum]KXG53589.1 hypothetical protein PGRI_006390 [Penicillium griseofulvum]